LVEEVNITLETIEKPRGMNAVIKTVFENVPGSTFLNRALRFDTLYLFLVLWNGIFRQSHR